MARAIALAWAALLACSARGDVPITALPYTAYLPDRYYLANDVTVPAGTLGFVVGASNVTFDLNGHTITCDGPPAALTRGVVSYGRSHFALANGRIRNCSYGFDSTGNPALSRNVRIENVQFLDNSFRGIRLDAANSEVLHNRIENTIGPYSGRGNGLFAIGIEVTGPGNVVRNNTVLETQGGTGGEAVGISLSDLGAGSVVFNNIIRNDPAISLDYGVWIGGSSDVRVEGNTIIGYTNGVAASSTTLGLLRNNTVLGADVPYFINGAWTDGGNNY